MDIDTVPCSVLRADPVILFSPVRLFIVYDVLDVVAIPEAMPRKISARIILIKINTENTDIREKPRIDVYFLPNLSENLPPAMEKKVNDNGNINIRRL